MRDVPVAACATSRRGDFDAAHPQRRDPQRGSGRLWGVASAWHVLVGWSLLASACGPETDRSTATPWNVTFACAAQAAQSETVEVAISPGTCASPTAPVYRANIRRGDANGTAAPPSLLVGTYSFGATAYDSSGEPVSAVCLDVTLPREQGVSLVLPGQPGCEPAKPPSGGDPGAAPDVPPVDDVPTGADAGIAPTDSGVPTTDASTPIADANVPPDPDPDPDAGPCVGTCEAAPTYSSPTKDISLPKQCWAPGELMPVTIHMPVTAKDWLWVRNHPNYGGSDQEFWDHTGITTAGAVYRGGEREPNGLHAPSTTGSFSITWHPNDASDKEVRSTLGFTVSTSCP